MIYLCSKVFATKSHNKKQATATGGQPVRYPASKTFIPLQYGPVAITACEESGLLIANFFVLSVMLRQESPLTKNSYEQLQCPLMPPRHIPFHLER